MICIQQQSGVSMLRFTSSEMQRHWGKVQNMALVEPVAVTSKGRDRLVIISWDEYHRLKRRHRQVMLPADFSEKDIADLENTRAPAETHAFDHEVSE